MDTIHTFRNPRESVNSNPFQVTENVPKWIVVVLGLGLMVVGSALLLGWWVLVYFWSYENLFGLQNLRQWVQQHSQELTLVGLTGLGLFFFGGLMCVHLPRKLRSTSWIFTGCTLAIFPLTFPFSLLVFAGYAQLIGVIVHDSNLEGFALWFRRVGRWYIGLTIVSLFITCGVSIGYRRVDLYFITSVWVTSAALGLWFLGILVWAQYAILRHLWHRR